MQENTLFPHVKNIVECRSGFEAVTRLISLYRKSLDQINDFFETLQQTDNNDIANLSYTGSFYPFVGFHIPASQMNMDARHSYGIAIDPGTYGTTITHPELFQKYYMEQIDLLIEHHNVPVFVGESDQYIPLPFAEEHLLNGEMHEKIAQMDVGFALPNLSRVDDQIANNAAWPSNGSLLPLSLFTAERVDYSLHRLHHYTGTAPQHFQNFILLTNYQRYIKEFIEYAHEEIEHGLEYSEFVGPGNSIIYNPHFKKKEAEDHQPEHLPQMPAYHLKRPDGEGITFINIGVGPSNAKNITDHLAVLRPHCWLMVGHCAGLRRSQVLGDYVLAHAYAREDHVLDQDLPLSVPIPALAEVQVALQDAVTNITGQRGRELKTRMRTGTVLTTDNRNWELLSDSMIHQFKQTRAIAVDMESATIAANGFRFRVPYGTLLCVSDKPIHGELKLKTSASSFYQQRVKQHLLIGLEAIRLIRENGIMSLHSRKLRGFEEPPFR
ncbi:MAG: AMP nucleosidase [Alphaproteobacteria bacterium]|nr:AMP nucleosidase [Alphaproteobacteria bacterium]